MTALDEYLARLSSELQASPEETVEILRELRAHLELATLDTRSEQDEDTRIQQALERFGTAQQIGQALRLVHGRATWTEIGLATLPLLLFGWLPTVLSLPYWITPAIMAMVACLAWRAHWPLWWWAWIGWVSLAFPALIPAAPLDLLWGGSTYVIVFLIAHRRGWLETTLALYPLSTAWAFQRVISTATEVRLMGWQTLPLNPLGLAMVCTWAVFLARTLRVPSKRARISRVLQSQAAILMINGLTIVAARLWPTYPYPYPYTLSYFLLTTLPYAIFHSLPFMIFFVMTSLPALIALTQPFLQRQPPSRPLVSG
jgi:hypothetical protein